MTLTHAVSTTFTQRFHEQPLLVRSPGRVNLIGEHTDYNMGFVLPAAIDKAITFAIAPRPGRVCRVCSLDMHAEHEFSPDELYTSSKRWPNYLMGVVDQMVKSGCPLEGFNCVFGGDIPIGAGLSSSAAIEAGLAYALNSLFELGFDELSLVKLAQRAENSFVGVQCGIMDQYVNIFGAKDHVLRVDCRSLEHRQYPFTFDVAIVLFDTKVSHSLATSAYNRRREECSEGAAIIRRSHPHVTHLRDVSMEMLQEHSTRIDATTYRRCAYVIDENQRVLDACIALEAGNLKLFGQQMFRTHEGLSRDYEVSCAELDSLVEFVANDPDVFGARMMGGGFGGCTINLVAPPGVERIIAMVREKYEGRYHRTPEVYVTSLSGGTTLIGAIEHARASYSI